LAPGATTMRFSPAWSTAIMARPVGTLVTVLTASASTPSVRRAASSVRTSAQLRSDSRSAPPRSCSIDHVVVDKRGGMRQLDRHCRRGQLLEVVPATFGRQQHHSRSDALSSGVEQVCHRRRDHIGIALDEPAQACLDGVEVTRDRTEDVLRPGL